MQLHQNQPTMASLNPPFLPNGATFPDLTKCRLCKPFSDVEVNCCPPPSSNIIDFTFPVVTEVKVRRAAHLVDATYIQNYEEALRRMKALPLDDPRNFTQQAKVHCAHCNAAYPQLGFPNIDYHVHNSWLFFPFHRWFLYFHERILASLIKDLDPNFALPFWNWDSPNGMQIPSMYVNPCSPLYDHLRNPNHQPPKLIDISYNGVEYHNKPDEQQVKENLCTIYRQMVSCPKIPLLFFGSPYRAGHVGQKRGGGSVEYVPHDSIHTWTGGIQHHRENMGTFYSAARDPVFYAHHANIDRMWSIWKTLGGKRKDIEDPDWLESGFFFYDENKNLVRVKVKDCLDTTKLGYVYQDVGIPWRNAKPSSTPTPPEGRFQRAKRKHIGDGAARTAEETKFPLSLDSTVSVVVKRPRKSRSKKEKEEEEEVLVVEGVEFESNLAVKFDVYIDDEDDVPGGPTRSEFAGAFVNVPMANKHKHMQENTKNEFRVGITELLQDLGVDNDEYVVVTFVPTLGKGHVTIGGIKIELLK